jgi:23S rRNA pseudouridine1911/1915/1917 synthase
MEHTFIVTEAESALRLDQLLPHRFPGYSRAYFQSLLGQGAVRVHGAPAKKRHKLPIGASVAVHFLPTETLSVAPEPLPLDILYEDEHLLVVNKPAGLVVHPAPGHARGTFANALLHHCHTLPDLDTLRPGIVHRLDKETSGLLIAAKTSEAHRRLVELFATRAVYKSYLALCIGIPPEGLIETRIRRHPQRRQEMCAHPTEGKEARSIVRVLHTAEGLSLVEVELLTGRTHQIRVHMKSVGTPVLGDKVYGSATGNQKWGAARQMLHAHKLRLTHPVTGALLECKAPPPADFLRLSPGI